MHVATHQQLIALQYEAMARGHEVEEHFIVGDALVDRARNIAASMFLRSDADVFLTIDADIWFRPEDALKLCEEAVEYGIIGALYVTRAKHPQPALMLPQDKEVEFVAWAKPEPVPFVSTGFLAVHRRVFDRLARRLPLCHKEWTDRGEDTSFWPFYMPYVIPWQGDGNLYLSEDWAFCERAKESGFVCWLDPSIRLGHYGEVLLTMEDIVREPRTAPGPMKLLRHADGKLETFTPERVV